MLFDLLFFVQNILFKRRSIIIQFIWIYFLTNGFQTDIIYSDFSKTFDRVPDDVLLQKLKTFGFSDNVIDLIKSYLTGRVQYVLYRGFRSVEVKGYSELLLNLDKWFPTKHQRIMYSNQIKNNYLTRCHS